MFRQGGLQIRHGFLQLSRLELCDAQGGRVLRFLQMRNCLGRVTLRQQRISHQSVRRDQVRIKFQGLLERRDRSAIVTVLQIRLTQANKAGGSRRLEFGHFTKFGNGCLEVAVLLSLGPGLHVLQGFERLAPRRKEQTRKEHESRSLRFTDFQNLVRVNVVQCLPDA